MCHRGTPALPALLDACAGVQVDDGDDDDVVEGDDRDGGAKDPYGYAVLLDKLIRKRGSSRKEFADAMGRTKAWASMVLRGQRRLRPGLVPVIADVLDLEEPERLELQARVDVAHANSVDARERGRRFLEGLERRREARQVDTGLRQAMSTWYVGAILELVRCDGYRPDPVWIAATLYPRITVQQAREALETLQSHGLLDEGFRPVVDPPGVATERSVSGEEGAREVTAIHKHALATAIESFGLFQHNERHIEGGIVALTDADYERMVARVHELAGSMLFAPSDEERPTRLYRFFIGVFPASLYTDTEYDPTELDD